MKPYELKTIVLKLDANEYNPTNFSGDFNVIFNALKATCGNSKIKTRTISKFFKLKDKFDSCDIWRIRLPKTKTFSFKQKYFSGFIHSRQNYIFISEKFQERT